MSDIILETRDLKKHFNIKGGRVVKAVDGVSIQAQVMNLLLNLQQKTNLSYIFIAHDLSMVRYISDTVAVMYLGSIMEYASNRELYEHPQHPYTKALFSAIPVANPEVEKQRRRIKLEGEIPSPINAPKGCSKQMGLA